MKNIEIVDRENKKHRFTITPDRLTVKLSVLASAEEREAVKNFCLVTIGQSDWANNVTQSWRGEVELYKNKLFTQLYTDREVHKKSFSEMLS